MSLTLSKSLSSIVVGCPVCGNACTDSPLYRYTASQAAAYFCPPTRDAERYRRFTDCIKRLWQGEECVILRCKSCEFAFGYPWVGGDEEFYSLLHEQRGYPTWRWDYDIAMQEVITPLQCGKILEIGAGAGVFLRSLSADWERYAVEGSETTRIELEASGINVIRNLELLAQSQAGTFQVIVMFQVLEHIAEFNSVLTQCRQLLTSGGQIVITVPDGEAMIRQEQLTGCPDMPPNHINKWTSASLAQALNNTEFTATSTIAEPPSLRNFRGALHLRVLADATNSHSIAAQVYRIQNKRLRVPLLAYLGVSAMFRLLPHWKKLQQGGAFAMVGVAR
jgi:SAM-dependent methyltransferase